MASPQLEDGYVRIANELLEAIVKFPFSKRQYKIMFAMIRQTYGYGKKSDDISLSQLSRFTDIDSANCSRALSELQSMKVLSKQQGRHGQVIEINKNYKQWTAIAKTARVLPKQQRSCQNSNRLLPKQQENPCQNSKAAIAKTANTKDNSKRQSQKTIPKDSCKGGKTTPCWQAYSEAYEIRYKVAPVRNARVNGQLANFLKRVGAEEAPHIASYYLTHNNQYYVARMHTVDAMLSDAEKLRTEWATRRQMTNTLAAQADKTQTNFSVFDKIKQENGNA